MKTILAIVVSLACIHSISCIECMSCTYTFAGAHGVYDRECVSAVYNFTKTRVVQCNDLCLTKAVYVTGYSRLNSLHRGCGFKREHYCDSPQSLVPTCELTCKEDKCNDGNGDLWEQLKPQPDPDSQGGGGAPGVVRGHASVVWTLAIAAVLGVKMMCLGNKSWT